MKLLTKLIICFGAFLLAVYAFPEHARTSDGVAALIAAAVILWLLNMFLRPILQLISLPVTIVTVGIFSLIVNAFMVRLTDALLPGLVLTGFPICIFIALVISAGNMLFASQRSGK